MPIYGSYHHLPALPLLQPLPEPSKRIQLISYRATPLFLRSLFPNSDLFRLA